MTENKKEWVTPELIVLVRSQPEETVLILCKTVSAGGGENNLNSQCRIDDICMGCYVSGAS